MAVRYARATPYVFSKEEGSYGGTLPECCTCFWTEEVLMDTLDPLQLCRISIYIGKEVGRIQLLWTPSRNAINWKKGREEKKIILRTLRQEEKETTWHKRDRRGNMAKKEKVLPYVSLQEEKKRSQSTNTAMIDPLQESCKQLRMP